MSLIEPVDLLFSLPKFATTSFFFERPSPGNSSGVRAHAVHDHLPELSETTGRVGTAHMSRVLGDSAIHDPGSRCVGFSTSSIVGVGSR
jgi:hypothetical protein